MSGARGGADLAARRRRVAWLMVVGVLWGLGEGAFMVWAGLLFGADAFRDPRFFTLLAVAVATWIPGAVLTAYAFYQSGRLRHIAWAMEALREHERLTAGSEEAERRRRKGAADEDE